MASPTRDPEGAPVPRSASIGRIESLDLLRGLCAIAVASYHMLGWLQIAHAYTLGLYGVYLFFLLSGASMAIAYTQRFRGGYPVAHYLALRYIRLAPLYALATTFAACVYSRPLFTTVQLLGRWVLNVTFAFGFANPGQTSLVTGGWSLGIEFVFYLVFPVLLVLVGYRRGVWCVLGLLGLQLVFVNLVLDKTTLEQAWVSYTQVAAFVGYFAFGTWVGLSRVEGRFAPTRYALPGWILWLALLAVTGMASGATAESTLTGARGIALVFACCALLVVTIRLEVPPRLRGVCEVLGNASYPMYLLHPIVFEVINRSGLLARVRADRPIAYAAIALTASFAASLVVYYWFEAPVLRWGKRQFLRQSASVG